MQRQKYTHGQKKKTKLFYIFIPLVSLVLILIIGAVLFAGNEKNNNDPCTENPDSCATDQQGEMTSVSSDEQQDEQELAEDNQETLDPTQESSQDSWPVVYTEEQAASLTAVVNKKHRLPSTYVPTLSSVSGGQVRPEVAADLQNLLNAAQANGTPLSIISSYRSYATQTSTYQGWVNTYGQAEADRVSARPGHSEHQTGLAIDLGNGTCDLETCFGDTAGGQWLAENAHTYGFIIRYPDGKESITGYSYEPWHLRYVGVDAAIAIYASGKTMDEYYNVQAGDYN